MTAATGISPLRALRGCALAAAAATLLLAAEAQAEDAGGGRVVVTVNGAPITEADLAIAARDLGEDLAKTPPEQRMQLVVDTVVEIKLYEMAAEKQGLDQLPAVKKRLEFLRGRALRNEYLLAKVGSVVTDEAVKKRYDEEAAKFVPGDELHMHHILVKTEDEAKAIIAELDKGGDFAAIAKEKSLDPGSGARGGDLGFVGRGVAVKPFDDAAFALAVGTYSKTPVETPLGWHIIKVDEQRKQPVPTFEARQKEIREALLTKFLEDETKALHDAATIVVVPEKPADAPPAAEQKPADGATTPETKPAEKPAQ